MVSHVSAVSGAVWNQAWNGAVYVKAIWNPNTPAMLSHGTGLPKSRRGSKALICVNKLGRGGDAAPDLEPPHGGWLEAGPQAREDLELEEGGVLEAQPARELSKCLRLRLGAKRTRR